jgi:hypothetical protein
VEFLATKLFDPIKGKRPNTFRGMLSFAFVIDKSLSFLDNSHVP